MSADQIGIIIILGLNLALASVGVIWATLIYPRLPKDQQAAARQRIVESVANQVVPAIQQSANDLDNPTKRAIAEQQIEQILANDFHIKGISPTLMSAAIEGAVFLMKQGIGAFKTWQLQQQEPSPNIPPPTPAA